MIAIVLLKILIHPNICLINILGSALFSNVFSVTHLKNILRIHNMNNNSEHIYFLLQVFVLTLKLLCNYIRNNN